MLWDFDDTLVDSLPARTHALARVFRDANIQGVDARCFLLSIAGNTLQASLSLLTEDAGQVRDLFERYRRVYWTKTPGTLRMYAEIAAVLDGLEQRGVLASPEIPGGAEMEPDPQPAR